MKKIITLIGILVSFNLALAENECAFDQIDCTGQCGSYTDKDNDSYCDIGAVSTDSEEIVITNTITPEQLQAKTVKEAANYFGVTTDELIQTIKANFNTPEIKENDLLLNLHDNNGVCMEALTAIINAKKNNVEYVADPNEISGAELKKMTIQEAANFYQINAKDFANEISKIFSVEKIDINDSLEVLHDNNGIDMHKTKSIAENLKSKNNPIIDNDKPIQLEPVKFIIKESKAEKYKFWEISIPLVLIYLISFLLYKLKKISFKLHRAIWNILLLISFLISGILGMFLAAGILFYLPFSMLDLHVKAGIFMFWITLFHVIERWRFFVHLACKKK